MRSSTIAVTFDKSHLVTIGEKLYGESLELLRELIANSYDADATEVRIEVRPETLTVRDDGSGMNEEGLREFFRIGSQQKRLAPLSPTYRRPRVGQFGIGKFAVLTACERFRVFTQREGFAAEVVFDKRAWEKEEDAWHVPMFEKPWNPHRGNGTTVTLEELKKTFALPEIERFIRERLPLTAPHFTMYLNGERIAPTYVPGRKFPVRVETPYGPVHGDLLLPNIMPKERTPGIECVVRGVMICRSAFGLESPVMQKLQGRINADFVPITSDRSRFITDSPEYRVFEAAMRKEIRMIARLLQDLTEKRERQKADETLRETLMKMRRAIRRNPDIAPPLLSPTGEVDAASEQNNSAKFAPPSPGEDDAISAMHMAVQTQESKGEQGPGHAGKEPPPKKIRVKNLSGKTIVARKIMIGGIGITCALEHCGESHPAAFTESGIVYINMDHPLYLRQQERGHDMLGFHLLYLLSQQVALLLAEEDARRAFEVQNRLLTDSW